MPEHAADPVRNPQPNGTGATIGVIIIVLLMLVGAIYYFSSTLRERRTERQVQLPLIPGDATTTVSQ